jgi:hypothetical protein
LRSEKICERSGNNGGLSPWQIMVYQTMKRTIIE